MFENVVRRLQSAYRRSYDDNVALLCHDRGEGCVKVAIENVVNQGDCVTRMEEIAVEKAT